MDCDFRKTNVKSRAGFICSFQMFLHWKNLNASWQETMSQWTGTPTFEFCVAAAVGTKTDLDNSQEESYLDSRQWRWWKSIYWRMIANVYPETAWACLSIGYPKIWFYTMFSQCSGTIFRYPISGSPGIQLKLFTSPIISNPMKHHWNQRRTILVKPKLEMDTH